VTDWRRVRQAQRLVLAQHSFKVVGDTEGMYVGHVMCACGAGGMPLSPDGYLRHLHGGLIAAQEDAARPWWRDAMGRLGTMLAID
jgi:hypothetical protein